MKAFQAREQRILVQAIEDQLLHQPTVPTRNRKLLRENPFAAWELRGQKFRVLYNVVDELATVFIVAIADKVGNQFVIEGEEYQL